jgi:hypothetical protein
MHECMGAVGGCVAMSASFAATLVTMSRLQYTARTQRQSIHYTAQYARYEQAYELVQNTSRTQR